MSFKASTDPGKMKHTFTGLRAEFPNQHIHAIILNAYKPLRVEIMRRSETGMEATLPEPLRTTIFEGIDYLVQEIREYTAESTMAPNITIDERKKLRQDFGEEIRDKGTDFEKLARQNSATHQDRVLQPGTTIPMSLTFDYQGLGDKDFAQPTPDRVQHPVLRTIVIGLDKLVVMMTDSHSADTETTIISREAEIWLAFLIDLRNVLDKYDPGNMPFFPTSRSINERETSFNADGSNDPLISDGDAPGERAGTNRTTSAPASQTNR